MNTTYVLNYFPIIIAALSLVISLLSYINSRKATNLSLEQFRQQEREKELQKFDITLFNTAGVEHFFYSREPTPLWAVKLSLNNKSDEQVIFADIEITLSFRGKYEASWHRNLHQILGPANDPRSQFSFTFSVLSTGWCRVEESAMFDYLPLSSELKEGLQDVYIMNWETKQPIEFTDFSKSIRGPLPGQKDIWLVFGTFPNWFGKKIEKKNISLINVQLDFFTDHGEINTNIPFFIPVGISDEFRQELEIVKKNWPPNPAST